MHIVTSIGISRTERQQTCIESWLSRGCTVTAVQSPNETEILRPLYPEVNFVETNKVGVVFNRPKLVEIDAILDQAVDSPILILNSDIEVFSSESRFKTTWEVPKPNVLKMGVRWDRNTNDGSVAILEYGIDAFLITPAIAKDLNRIGMTMGCPAWDYWIPIHLARMNYTFIVNKSPELIHDLHEKNWTKEDFHIGVNLLTRHYGMSLREASAYIQQITRRGMFA